MNKIVISGYYGFNNIGDESILTAIISGINDTVENADIVVLSKKPELTSHKHNVKQIDRKNIFKIISEIKNCQLLISGGGGLLQDVTSSKSILYYLAIMGIGKIFKKKVMIYSQGMGPINKPLNRKLTKYILNKVDFITLRDEKSRKFLKEINVNNKNINVTADPVIGIIKSDLSLGHKILKDAGLEDNEKPIVGLSIRGRNKDNKLVNMIARVCDRIIDEFGVNIVFIPFHQGEDIKIIEDIKVEMNREAIGLTEHGVDETLSIIGNLDLLVGVRLHSLIFGDIMNVPMIAISYDPKIDNFMNYLDQQIISNIEDLDEDELIAEIKNKLNNEDMYRLQLYNKIECLKERLHRNEEVISELLNLS